MTSAVVLTCQFSFFKTDFFVVATIGVDSDNNKYVIDIYKINHIPAEQPQILIDKFKVQTKKNESRDCWISRSIKGSYANERKFIYGAKVRCKA